MTDSSDVILSVSEAPSRGGEEESGGIEMNPGEEDSGGIEMNPLHSNKVEEWDEVNIGGPRAGSESLSGTAERLIEAYGFGRYQKRLCLLNGALWMADSMEVSLLSFLYQCVGASFNLTSAQAASIVSVVFAGELLGAVAAGPLADAYGRRPVSIIAAILVAVFGTLTAFAPTFCTIVACRCVVGVAVGSLAVPFDLLAEMLPSSHRGSQLTILNFAWAAGAMYAAGASWLTRAYSWRLLVLVCSLPFVIVAVFVIFLIDESPKWLAEQGQTKKLAAVLYKVAKVNGKEDINSSEPLFTNDSIYHAPQETTSVRAHFIEGLSTFASLFGSKRGLRRTTALIYVVWIGFGLDFYGISLLATRLFSRQTSSDFNCSFDYAFIFGITTSEILGTAALLFFIDRIGRVKSQFIPYFLTALALAPVALIYSNSNTNSQKIAIFACLYVALGAQMMASAASWVHVADLYPTDLRATGHSLALTVSRVSAFATSYLVDSTLSIASVIAVLSIAAFAASIAASRLPEKSTSESS